jgi:nicotinamidase-related amidase
MSASEFGSPRSPELLSRANCKLLVVDVQEKLLPLIKRADRLLANCRFVIQGAQILGVPVYATEQYPQGLGATAPTLAELLPKPPEKRRFSCAEVLNWGGAAEQSDDRHQVVVIGIEAHVCVQQSVLDLIAQGFQVFVAADAVASRNKFDWRIALQRMSLSGAVITTSEAVIFEWCETAAAAEFKQISELVKQR